ncbi:hypothetical protein LJK88_28395 [Paenibacillus sp. P26]|nr:hypothetical protein LJK88_28395 [Paenibacillus sp. P26]
MGKTTRVFFVRNLLTFLIPMLIPILILGTLSSVIIQRFVTNEINPTNIHLLQQTKENIELVFNEQESLHLHIIASAVEFISLKSMLEKPYPDPEDYRRLASLKNFIDSPAIGRPYIDSIYIYVNNSRNRFVSSTTGGLVDLRDYYDQGWYDSYRAHSPQEEMWTESRTVSRPTIRNGTVDTGLITLYRRISVSDEKDGLIVLNVKRDYIEQPLSGPVSQSGQVLLILSPDNEVLTQSRDTVELNRPGLAYLNARQEPAFEWSPGNETLVVNKLHSDKYRWTFLSIVPKASLYESPDRLNQLTLTLLLLSFLSGTVLAYYLTKNNHKDLKTIIGVLDSAKNGRPLPSARAGQERVPVHPVQPDLQFYRA